MITGQIGLVEDMREAARKQILAGMEANKTPQSIALDLIGRKSKLTGKRVGGVIGLTARQADFIIEAEAKLLSGDPGLMREYLALKTRDLRFDGIVRRAIKDGKAISSSDATRLIARLREKNLRYRAKLIADNETITAMRAGRHEGYRQLLDSGAVSENQIERSWDATGDARTRPDHMIMEGQTVRGLTAPFTFPDDSQAMFPGDSSLGAPASQTVRCRCFERVRIRYIR